MHKTYAKRRLLALMGIAGFITFIASDPIRLVFSLVWNFYATLTGGVTL